MRLLTPKSIGKGGAAEIIEGSRFLLEVTQKLGIKQLTGVGRELRERSGRLLSQLMTSQNLLDDGRDTVQWVRVGNALESVFGKVMAAFLEGAGEALLVREILHGFLGFCLGMGKKLASDDGVDEIIPFFPLAQALAFVESVENECLSCRDV